MLAGIQRFTGSRITGKKWIFIVGCYNSGTTLLATILNGHSKISGLEDEGVMLTNQLSRPEDFLWRRMWHKCEDKMRVELTNEVKVAERTKRDWSHFFDHSKEFFMEKSISNTPRIDFFERQFSPAYFIHIVRNGFAVSEGIRRKARVMEGNPHFKGDNEKYPLLLCAEQWRRSVELVESFKPSLKNFLEISYESLTEKPAETIKNVTDFLGVEELNDSFLQDQFVVHGRQNKIENQNPSSLARLERTELKLIQSICFKELQRYGYV